MCWKKVLFIVSISSIAGVDEEKEGNAVLLGLKFPAVVTSVSVTAILPVVIVIGLLLA